MPSRHLGPQERQILVPSPDLRGIENDWDLSSKRGDAEHRGRQLQTGCQHVGLERVRAPRVARRPGPQFGRIRRRRNVAAMVKVSGPVMAKGSATPSSKPPPFVMTSGLPSGEQDWDLAGVMVPALAT